MSGAILWAFVVGGFWGEHTGHWESRLYPNLSCRDAEPIEEERIKAMGQIVRETKCVEVRERG